MTELKVILRGFWLLHRKRGWPRLVSMEEFLSDPTLIRGFKNFRDGPKMAIIRGLGLAVERGIFLVHHPEQEPGRGVFYLLNTDSDRKAWAKLNSDFTTAPVAGQDDAPIPTGEPAPERPNIFALYEDNVGMISPIIAEELKEAEELYPWNWLRDAFKIAVTRNHRNWGYITGILRRWAAEGNGPAAGRGSEGRGSEGRDLDDPPHGEGREDGEPGRHTAKSNRQKFLEDYQRRWSKTSDQPT